MNEQQKQKCREIYGHYGRDRQLIQLLEELGELQSSVARAIAGKPNNICEEMADVLIMIEQIKNSDFHISAEIEAVADNKLERQLERIAKDKKKGVGSAKASEKEMFSVQ